MERVLSIVSPMQYLPFVAYRIVAPSTFVGQMPELSLEVLGGESRDETKWKGAYIGQTNASYADLMDLSPDGPLEIGKLFHKICGSYSRTDIIFRGRQILPASVE